MTSSLVLTGIFLQDAVTRTTVMTSSLVLTGIFLQDAVTRTTVMTSSLVLTSQSHDNIQTFTPRIQLL